MRKIIKFYLLLFSFSGQTQNLVLNPSFENFSICPMNSNQVPNAIGWNNFGESPDYFNSCSLNPDFSVPNNWGGYQQAASGNAYCAFGTYLSHLFGLNNIREFIGGQLSSSLNIGTKYYVSFKVSLSLDSVIQANCASNKIGAMFSTIPYTWINPAPKTNNPQVYTDSLITDTLKWTKLFGSFIADSLFQYIIIGNFFTDNYTDTLIMNGANFCYYAYYYLDDICVSTDSLYTLNYMNISEPKIESNFSIYPNPTKDYIYISFKNFLETYNLFIYNTMGQELLCLENINKNNIQIDINGYNTSMLLIRIITKNNSFYFKILKL